MPRHVRPVVRQKHASVSNTAEYFAKRERRGPPWFLICKEVLKGRSLESISHQFGVSIASIEKRMQLAISSRPDEETIDSGSDSGGLKVRNTAEIREISRAIRTDLSSALQTLVHEFNSAELSLDDLDCLKSLIDAANKLFGWNAQREQFAPVVLPSHAVNLALIQTTPEQLKAMGPQPTGNPS